MKVARFHWDIANGRLHWSKNAHEVLGLPEDADISTIDALLSHVDPSHSNLHQEMIFDATDAARREYVIRYRFLPEGRDGERGVMVVEHGRWLVDAEGRPAHVFGDISRMECVPGELLATSSLPDQMDSCSGLYNRSYFLKRLATFLKNDSKNGRNAALIILSLKNYSIIFDAYGFKVADAAFIEVGNRLKRIMRAGDILARYGHKRLAMLVHDCDEEDLGPAMERFLEAPCREPVQTELGPVWPMLALGATIIPRHAGTLSQAVAFAEEALAEAEQQPGTSGRLYDIATSNASRRAMKAHFANEVFAALREQSFTLAYQPVVTPDGAETMYHEALLYLFNEEDTATPAGHLVPVAEELGLIRLVDLEVLDLALEALRRQPRGRLGINASATTVMDAETFLARLASHAELVRDRLIVEITESSMLSHPVRVAHFIDRLHELGCMVALDDFGAGYTSFRNLRDYHFDIVKLDGAFCENLAGNEHNQHFMRSLIDLARNTDTVIIAEWVEREEDARLLREWGVHGLQGYLFGAPGHRNSHWPALRRKKAVSDTMMLSAATAAEKAPGHEPPVMQQDMETDAGTGAETGTETGALTATTGKTTAATGKATEGGAEIPADEGAATTARDAGETGMWVGTEDPAGHVAGELPAITASSALGGQAQSLPPALSIPQGSATAISNVAGVRGVMRELEKELAGLRDILARLEKTRASFSASSNTSLRKG